MPFHARRVRRDKKILLWCPAGPRVGFERAGSNRVGAQDLVLIRRPCLSSGQKRRGRSVAFCLVHAGVRRLQECRGVIEVSTPRSSTDTGADHSRRPIDGEGRLKGLDDPLLHRLNLRLRRCTGNQDGEFISAEARNSVARAYRRLQATSYLVK